MDQRLAGGLGGGAKHFSSKIFERPDVTSGLFGTTDHFISLVVSSRHGQPKSGGGCIFEMTPRTLTGSEVEKM